MAIQNDCTFFSGNDVVFTGTAIDELSQDILDLSGSIELTYAISKRASGTPLVQKTLGNGVIIQSPLLGKFLISLTPSDTEALSGKYYHELRWKNSVGKIATLMYGDLEIIVNLVRG